MGFLLPAQPPVILAAIVLMLAGGLVAADLRPGRNAIVGIGASVGLFHGYLNGAALVSGGEMALPLCGAAVVVLVIVALLSAVVVGVKAAWGRIIVRVAGSWIAATGLLLMGWALRKA